MTMDEIGIACGTDKATIHPVGAHGYTLHYEKFLEPIRQNDLKLVEIGVGSGESMKMWLEYLPNAKVVGIDIVSKTNIWNDPDSSPHQRYKFCQGDQSSDDFWNSFITDYGADWDCVCDDGAHVSQHIITTFKHMWPAVKLGGCYCIEDLHCSYYPEFQRDGYETHMQFIKDMLDSINRSQREMDSLHFSRQLAIIRKARV